MKEEKAYTYVTYFLWLIGFIVLIYIIYQYIICNSPSLLGALGILISAFLASVTMARSYAQNERFKEEERYKKDFKIKKFAILAALEVFEAYYKQGDDLQILKESRYKYATQIRESSELLKDYYNKTLHLAIVLMYDNIEDPIISKVAKENNKLIQLAKSLEITHPFSEISL